ncbi:MAG TPA: 3-dehydroquinate synthase family protein [Acidimicrobiia bacterium]|nr:3-dehydroquinate synthase family protein [Acidimicrobiia bacterium]
MSSIVITEGEAVVSEILIGRGLLSDIGNLLPERAGRRHVAILAQPSVAGRAHDISRSVTSTGVAASIIVLPDGESAKDLRVVESIAHDLNRLGMRRGDTVIGVGGGAATDVAGFVAATYLRGIECLLIPTTMLGAVDAAVGGKTGVNVGGKNLVGVFSHPARVLIDIDILEALPLDLRRQGTAEALKVGFVGDPELVALYRRHGIDAPLEEIVERAIGVKARVVSQDFREGGVRAVLNYGHTVGHGVEVAAGISHGEAVAIGMVAAGVVGERTVGFAGRIDQEELIASLGLPTKSPHVDRLTVEHLMALDKKRDSEGVRFVVLEKIGVPLVVHPDDATVRAALHAIGVD